MFLDPSLVIILIFDPFGFFAFVFIVFTGLFCLDGISAIECWLGYVNSLTSKIFYVMSIFLPVHKVNSYCYIIVSVCHLAGGFVFWGAERGMSFWFVLSISLFSSYAMPYRHMGRPNVPGYR